MADSFYFRVRGEVKGPFSREQIIALVRKKRLGRHHELSPDGLNWQRAGEIEGLFESIVPEERLSEESIEETNATAGNSGSSVTSQNTSSFTPQSAGGPDDWFYAKGRNTHGPVSSKDLRAMLATGRVQGSDRIWHESLSDWVPASDVPQFMGSIQDTGDPYTSPVVARQPYVQQTPSSNFFDIFLGLSSDTALPNAAFRKFPNLCRYLTIGESVFRILFALQIFLVAGSYAFNVFSAIQTESGSFIAVAVVVGAFALMLIVAILWFVFLAMMAMLETLKVMIRIEDNTAK